MVDDGHNIKGLTIGLTQTLENLPLPTGRPLSFDKLRMVSLSNHLPKRGNSSLRQREVRRDFRNQSRYYSEMVHNVGK
jgi:hypothetical protein